MVRLNKIQIDWLRENFPELTYDNQSNTLSGKLHFSLQFSGCPAITDDYSIKVLFNEEDYSLLPVVHETGGKICRLAKIANISVDALHQYDNGQVCMIRPDKVEQWYPEGFDLPTFMDHLKTHFYWVTHTATYGKEPWAGEPHGGNFKNNSPYFNKQ